MLHICFSFGLKRQRVDGDGNDVLTSALALFLNQAMSPLAKSARTDHPFAPDQVLGAPSTPTTEPDAEVADSGGDATIDVLAERLAIVTVVN